ncbi:MAG: NAD(P)/FAD-dependent oxidoreductase, partial [Myxococcales bacterium]|nr:NAD(P)/FAD-dependent oxidoreductase [Myxococcales bacterium]
MSVPHFDVLIVGAGLSGIGAAWQLQHACPGRTYAVLESRSAMGGTWDLFRYPGIRSDSDMYTLGYRFRPWTGDKALADGPSILQYIRDTASEAGIDRHIRYQHKVVSADWSTPDNRWTVVVAVGAGGDLQTFTCGFLWACSGYYSYAKGYTPTWQGMDTYKGRLIHPQHWPQDMDWTGKRVVVVGSGATAITLVPAMAEKAEHVTMLQRTPTWVASVPGRDKISSALRKRLSEETAYKLTRAKNVAFQIVTYHMARSRPELMKSFLRKGLQQHLPETFDWQTHFSPPYNPWDQRLCAVPDADLFRAISAGKVSVVTDTIDTFNETGVRLHSGQQLDADIIVTATGFNLVFFGGARISVDGQKINVAEKLAYKGLMLSDVPNHAFTVGYTNASWT